MVYQVKNYGGSQMAAQIIVQQGDAMISKCLNLTASTNSIRYTNIWTFCNQYTKKHHAITVVDVLYIITARW